MKNNFFILQLKYLERNVETGKMLAENGLQNRMDVMLQIMWTSR